MRKLRKNFLLLSLVSSLGFPQGIWGSESDRGIVHLMKRMYETATGGASTDLTVADLPEALARGAGYLVQLSIKSAAVLVDYTGGNSATFLIPVGKEYLGYWSQSKTSSKVGFYANLPLVGNTNLYIGWNFHRRCLILGAHCSQNDLMVRDQPFRFSLAGELNLQREGVSLGTLSGKLSHAPFALVVKISKGKVYILKGLLVEKTALKDTLAFGKAKLSLNFFRRQVAFIGKAWGEDRTLTLTTPEKADAVVFPIPEGVCH